MFGEVTGEGPAGEGPRGDFRRGDSEECPYCLRLFAFWNFDYHVKRCRDKDRHD